MHVYTTRLNVAWIVGSIPLDPFANHFLFVEPFAVLPGVHLFGDDVGFFADAAGEEAGVFENGCPDFAEVVAGEDGAGGGLDAIPEGRFGREQVARAPHGFEGGHDLSILDVRFAGCSARRDLTLVPGKPLSKGEETVNWTPPRG